MKKIICFLQICVLVLSLLLSACSKSEPKDIPTYGGVKNKIVITTTVFPIYDFVKNIIKGVDNIEINMLLDSGIDLHNFQPSAKDIVTIKNSDMFIYVGGESDSWVDVTLETAQSDKLINVNLMEYMKSDMFSDVSTLYNEEEMEEVEEHHHEYEEEHHHEEGEEFDEHIWLSLENAKAIVRIITYNLSSLDTKNSSLYNENSKKYIDELENLNQKFKQLFDTDGEKVMVVADRFPFLYFCKDYNIKYFAAFKGCSSQTEASFQTIKSLTDKVDEYNLHYIFKIEKSDTKIADTIIANSKNKNQEILVLNSIQEVTKDELENGVTYLSLMEENYNVLINFVKN